MTNHASEQGRYRGALMVITSIFFMWGLLTSLNDVLIPHLKGVFSLNYTQTMLIQFTFFGAYFIVSLPAGKLVARLGYKNSISFGLLVAGIGALLFFPAAKVPSYPLFLTALFVLASGITVLQVAANPYASLLGPERSSSSRLNLAQAFNSLGTTVGPALGGLLILSGAALSNADVSALAGEAASRLQEAQLVQGPYLILAAILFILAVVIFFWRLPNFKDQAQSDNTDHLSYGEALRHRHVVLGMLGIFAYVGAEVSIGSFLINYITQEEIGNMSEGSAANYVAYYWGGAMIGRFIGSALLQKIRAGLLLGLFAVVASLLLIVTMITTGHVAMWSVVAIGLFNSIMFPTIFTLGIAKMGPLTSKASSLLIMAIVGGAILPVVMGFLADHIGIQRAFVLPLLCYIYILFYGLKGSEVLNPVAHEEEGVAARSAH